MSNYKGNENEQTFVQKDVFKELELAENAVTDIYQFKEDFRVKTIYEKYGGLYKFGDKFKYVLSFITASLASIGFFFLFYFDSFEGVFNYILLGLSVVFAAAMCVGLEYARYVIAPIVAKSYLRDGKLQKALIIAALSIQIASISSTVYGTYKVIELYYTPKLADENSVGGEDSQQIANYEAKIKEAKAEKQGIEKRRAKYEKSSGKNGSWIQDEDYRRLTAQISDFEASIVNLRENIRIDKKTLRSDNNAVLAQHGKDKYLFVWVSLVIALLSEILLTTILFLLQKYKYSTLKQLDVIQSPLQTILQLVENPLTQLKANLIGVGGSHSLTPNIATNVVTNNNKKPIGFNNTPKPSNEPIKPPTENSNKTSNKTVITMASATKSYHEYHKRLNQKYTEVRQARVNYFASLISQMAANKLDRIEAPEFDVNTYIDK